MAHLLAVVVCFLGGSISTATDKLAHCSDTTSPTQNDLNVILGSGAKSHTCSNEPDVIDFDAMMTQCSSFCGSKRISLLLGTESTGFNLSSLDSVCVGDEGSASLLVHNRTLMSECKKSYRSIDRIKFRVADFIASVRNITYSQQLFKAAMIDKVKALQKVMFSPKTKEDMDLASVNRKMERLSSILKENLADLMKSGVLSMDLRDKLSNLRTKAEILEETIDTELPRLKFFASDCNTLLLGTSSTDEYLLDICSVTSDECIESQYGRHIGCCCGVIPAAGVFSSEGISPSRRLAEETDIDSCGKAYAISQPSVDAIVEQIMATSEGRRILEEFDTAQKTQYSDFYTDCEARRLAEASHEVGDDAAFNSTNADIETVQKVRFLAKDGSDHDTSRHLQGLYLTCNPPGKPSDSTNVQDNLKVAFTQTTEEALCKNIEGMTDEKLAQMCQDFCAPTAVPFLLGSLTYGFNQAEMDEVCLKPDDTYFSQEHIDLCHEQGDSFNTLQEKTASLVAKLELLENAKLLFEAKAQSAATDLQNLLKEKAEEKIDNVATSQKLNALRNLVAEGLSDFMGAGAASLDVKITAEDVEAAALALTNNIKTVIPNLLDFMENCNMLMTGVGRENEYLLDMCAQDSKECLEAAEASHVGCCCGYNPVVALGTSADSITIEGILAEKTKAEQSNADVTGTGRIRVGNRRLSAMETKASVNICGQAAELSKAGVAEYKAEIDAIDKSLW
jgi:hypothetical protein